jgi:hypothetical protein
MANQLPPKQPPRVVTKPVPKPSVIIKGNQWARVTSKPSASSRPLPAPKPSTPPAK